MKRKWIVALAAALLGVAAYVGNVLATPSQGQATTILAKATVDDLDLRGQQMTTTVGSDGKTHPNGVWLAWLKTHGSSDMYVVDNKFAPNGGTSGWHSHPGPSVVFVVAGTVKNYSSDEPGCAPEVYTAGQSFVDPGGDDEHKIVNEDTSVTAETIAVQIIPAGATRRIEKPAPEGCPA
jgi:quercetin dioxygenase-like cupin family protein